MLTGPVTDPTGSATNLTGSVTDRLAADRYTIDDIPESVARHGGPLDMLPVGSPGKVGVLDLIFARRGDRTELVGHYQKSPLQIMRPLYYDLARPDIPYVILMTAGGGIVQGDRYRFDFTCEADTSVHLTTQAATKIYRMEQDYATQLVTLRAGPGAYLEYLPDPVIPYVDSRFYQRVTLDLDPTASAVTAETVLAGRLAHGERHAYTAYCNDLTAHAPDGRLLFTDSIHLEPGRDPVHGPATFGDHGAMSTFYAMTSAVPATDLADLLHEVATANGDVTAGASVLPNGAGAWVRLLAPESPEITETITRLWTATRHLLTGSPTPDRRRF
ncbi:urease accessory protein UreD [Spongiactinospora sp. TRM90649]|uniref:urease accessory protein UreD n=1 Tax=Spongiactinospora sp. TRM90649 TaxID=3031114 RepID=UPI0023F7AA1A|nr:urease accessory protein UreD [Spongiactinospora sp. TRM90649]MDF5756122.1 urease accessory protein UreD [Spongiactinospora sp. TRM90649]